MSTKVYAGSCHCKKVRFEAELDLAAGAGRCNCSFCAKSRNWSMMIKPAQFKLLSDAADVGAYAFKPGATIQHEFCKTCGIRTFTRGALPQLGGDFVSISVAALDGVSDAELAAMPLRYADGRNNDWWHEPEVKSYL